MIRFSRGLIPRLLGALLGFGFGASVALAVPRMWRFDYSRVALWDVGNGTYSMEGFEGIPGMLDTAGVPTDSAGVAIVQYGGDLGDQYNPTIVALEAVRRSSRLDSPEDRRAFWTQIRWLTRKARADGRRGVVWEYEMDIPMMRQKAPWISAMAQGAAMSALTRAYRASGDSAYLRLAGAALPVFELDEKNGGVVRHMGSLAIYQEYPGDRYVVLDGWLVALAGVQEYYLATGDPHAGRVLDRGLHTMRVLLPQFDNAFAVYYSSRRGLPRPHYFALSYNLLRYLRTYDPALEPAVRRWARHRRSGFWAKYLRVYYQSLNWRLSPRRTGPDLEVEGSA